MDEKQFVAAMVVIAGSTIGIVEAFKPLGLPEKFRPVTAILVGAALGTVYLFLPPETRSLFLVLLAGATGTATYAISQQIRGGAVHSEGRKK